MNVTILIPDTFVAERSYTLNVLFGYFKDFTVSIIPQKRKDYAFLLDGDEFLLIHDQFWNQINENTQNYLSPDLIPSVIYEFSLSVDDVTHNMLSLFGKQINEQNVSEKLTLNADIIASSFFMLSRWEESINENLDIHNRFPDKEATAIRLGFEKRPIVNEYIAFIKALISSKSGEKIVYNRSYKCYITHDVDEIFRLKPIKKFFKALGGDLIHRKSLFYFFKTIKDWFVANFNNEKDPSYTFNYLMDLSEKHGLLSHFYFIPGKKGEVDFRYDFKNNHIDLLIENISNRGHIIGVHPSYSAFGSNTQFTEEIKRIRTKSPEAILEGRHHYLRCTVPETFRKWEAEGLKIDSSLGYHETVGFRCGICFTYPLFDCLERKQLKLKERPLTFMEVALAQKTMDPTEFLEHVLEVINTTKKYNGDFVFLWHNNNINHPYWKKLASQYETIIKEASSLESSYVY